VPDQTYDTFAPNKDLESNRSNLELLIVIVLSIFSAIGILVNALLMLAIKWEKRTLFLPWLVFHLITVMGKIFLYALVLSPLNRQ